MSEPESAKEQSFNLPLEIIVSSGEQNRSEFESTKEQSFNLPPEITVSLGEQSLSELESTEEQRFSLPPEVTISSVSEALPYNSTDSNSGDVAPTDNKSDCDSDSDSTDGDSGNSGVKQEPSRKVPSLISNLAKKAKGWYSPKKLEEFYPLTEEDAALLTHLTQGKEKLDKNNDVNIVSCIK